MRRNKTRQRTLSLAEIRSELDELKIEASEIIEDAKTEHRDLDDDEDERVVEITERVTELRDLEEKALEKQANLRSLVDSGAIEHTSSTPTATRGNTERDIVLRNLDADVKHKVITEAEAGTVESLMRGDEGSTATRYARIAGDPEYRSAFVKLYRDPVGGHREFTNAEADAFRSAQTLSRAMNEGTGSQGGYLVPLSLDPHIILTSGGSVNPIRAIAKNVTITGQAWRGVSSAGVTAEWTPEATEMADASPTIANPVIPVHKADAFIPFSWEVEQDSAALLDELRTLLVDGIEQLTATAFATGTGTGQPRGVVTALVAAGAPYIVTPGVAETLTASDVYGLQGALPSRFQPNAQWTGNLSTIGRVRQFETANGATVFPELANGVLLGRKFNEMSTLDGFNPAVTDASNVVLIYGDWSNYVVVNRIGTTLEIIPQLFGANRRPTGQRGAVMYTRVGGDVVNSNGFRALNIATTA